MKKVLITGANGFVGKHLVRELEAHNIEVVCVDRPHPDRPELPKNHLALDLNSLAEVEQIDFSEITGVIHLAGLAAVGPSFDDPMLYIATNVGIECNLFEAALKQDASPRFLIISSGSLYDAGAPLPLTETSSVVPSSPYAISKLGQEQLAQYYRGRGFEIIIARPFNHIGPGQGPGFIVPDIAQQLVAIEEGKQSEVLVGNLDAQRDYTDVRDIVRAYRLLLQAGVTGEIYNVCSGKPYSGHDIVDGLIAASGTRPTVTTDPKRLRPADNPVIYGDHAKLTAATGWQPEIGIDQTFKAVLENFRTRTTSH